jgi:hypothetical protein
LEEALNLSSDRILNEYIYIYIYVYIYIKHTLIGICKTEIMRIIEVNRNVWSLEAINYSVYTRARIHTHTHTHTQYIYIYIYIYIYNTHVLFLYRNLKSIFFED